MKKEPSKSAKALVTELLNMAGIVINGHNPWDVRINNEGFYSRVLKNPELNLGESYIDGWWDCDHIDQMIERILRANIQGKLKTNLHLVLRLLVSKIINFQTKERSLQVGKQHYDIGNDLYQAMLDSKMNYTCGYWKNATNLEQAQEAKLDLVCQKLAIEPGMRLLDIGCGWGALAEHAAKYYGATVVGVTISKEQCKLAQERCKNQPIEIRFQDYRDINERFDRIASLGMFEHVGYKNYRRYMEIVDQCLVDDGLFLLHTIGSNESSTDTNPWIRKYIFPNSMLPSIAQIGQATEHLLILEDWHNFGQDYGKTLAAWHHNFNAHWDTLKHRYDDNFYRMWNFYLMMSKGGFDDRLNQLWQIVFSKPGYKKRYETIR